MNKIVSMVKNESVHLSQDVKRSIVEEYISGTASMKEVQTRYGIKGHSAIRKWMLALGYAFKSPAAKYLGKTNQELMNKKTSKGRVYNQDDSPEVRELKIKLRDRDLVIEIQNRMIDLAEGQYKIDIRKKIYSK